MSLPRSRAFASVLVPLLLITAGCGGTTGEEATSTSGAGAGANAGGGGHGAHGGHGGSGGDGGGIILPDGGPDDAPSDADPCVGMQCPADQHCSSTDGKCINNTCADLQCTATE